MPSISTISNQAKAVHGLQNKNALCKVLKDCLDNGYISDFSENFRIGSPSAKNSKQFYAPFMIQFPNRTRWVIFATTSMRSDRIKGQQWDALNLKELDTSITCAVLAYSNQSPDCDKFQQQNARFASNQEISAIDKVLDFEKLKQAIENEFYNQIKEEVELPSDGCDLKQPKQIEQFLTQGRIWDKQGKNFEAHIAQILTSQKNLDKWKCGAPDTGQGEYSHFCQMMSCFKLNPNNVKKISATAKKSDIGYLPSGGSPKTDVLVTVLFADDTTRTITISCKRSKMDMVSVHQYSADVFADVLDANNDALRKLLNVFQYYGNAKDLPAGICEQLTAELAPYVKKLVLWAIGGIGGDGTKTQLAEYIVSYQTTKNVFAVHAVDDYYDVICNHKCMFGTPMQWTYASKCKGKSIQLKAPVV